MGHDGHNPWTDEKWADILMSIEPKAVRLAWRLTDDRGEAEDIAHEAIAQLFAKGSFTPEISIEAVVMTCVRNRCTDWHRKQVRHPRASMTLDDGSTRDFEDDHPDALALFLAEETQESIDRALGELAPDLRHLLTLRYVDGLTLAEIAAETHRAIGTIHKKLNEAVAQVAIIVERGRVHV